MSGATADDAPVDGVATRTEGGVLHVRLDRPERKNALDAAAIGRVVGALEEAATDDGLRVVWLTGAGPDFCSGADWVARNADGAPRPRPGSIQRRLPLQAHRVIELLVGIQLPVVCSVQGWAAGLGCQLALAADFTVAADSSRFWLPFTRRGFTPDSGATWLLPRLVGVARAKELLLLGREITGARAAEWGMVHRAVPPEDVEAASAELVEELAAAATVALGLTKKCVHQGLGTGLVEAMDNEAVALELSSRTTDFKEGLRAFAEHRDAEFDGR